MTVITREPARAAAEEHDVVIIGGGIYGAMLLLEAAGHGLKALLLEQNDFGSGTSFNSLRIIHGGIRYLQSLDLQRSQAMIRERAWFLAQFPDLVRPLPCVMPLYNRGLKRTSTLGPALRLDNVLSGRANGSLAATQRVPPGRLIDAAEMARLFPQVVRNSLRGGAIWHDAQVPDSPRLVLETLRWGAAMGGRALNYVAARDLLQDGDRVCGVAARDAVSGEELQFRAKVVINAAGPSSRSLAARFDRDVPDLFRPSLAWNVLFDRPQLSDHALAVSHEGPGARVYFLCPWKGRMLAGTGHSQASSGSQQVTGQQLEEMMSDLNRAVPGLGLTAREIRQVFAGLLPVRREGTVELATREQVFDHGRRGGPEGLFSVSGVKLSASRHAAEKAIRAVCRRFFPQGQASSANLQPRPTPNHGWNQDPGADGGQGPFMAELGRLAAEEAVVHLDDLVYRRTTLWEHRDFLAASAPRLAELPGWDAARRRQELARLEALLADAKRWRESS